MELFEKSQNKILVQIFSVGKNQSYHNMITIMRPIKCTTEQSQWKMVSGPSNSRLFELNTDEGAARKIIAEITKKECYSIPTPDKARSVIFGELLKRGQVFLPNIPDTSLQSEWWPGSVKEGFFLEQWYGGRRFSFEAANEVAFRKIFGFIKQRSGIDVEHLQDFLGSILLMSNDFTIIPEITYSSETNKVLFSIKGLVSPKPWRIVVELWEGRECLHKSLFELNDREQACCLDAPFAPTALGYEIYEQESNGSWRLLHKICCPLLRKINIGMGVVSGKLIIQKPTGDTEDLDIVVHDRDIAISGENGTQPWLEAEQDRLRINRNLEVRELGSMFIRFDGNKTREKIWGIIHNRILNHSNGKLWIWDPYLDASILDDLVVLSLRNPSLNVRLLLSEFLGERSEEGMENTENKVMQEGKTKISQNADPITALNCLPRCSRIYSYLTRNTQDKALARLKEVENLQVRNWFRSGNHVFHDRFIIVESHSLAVWHLGSSLKDLGNFHSTIYRLDGEMPIEVKEEFSRSWEGRFEQMNPRGLEIFPNLQWLKVGGGKS